MSTATGSSAENGTLVTSGYDWSTIDPQWKEADIFPMGASRPCATLGILERTLSALRAAQTALRAEVSPYGLVAASDWMAASPTIGRFRRNPPAEP